MAIGKGLKSFVDAYMKAMELAQKRQYYELQLAFLAKKYGGKDGTGDANAAFEKGKEGYKDQPLAPVREGRSAGVNVTDPADKTLPPHAKAFLNAVAAPESGGEYDRLYAGQNAPPTYFEDYAQHPDMGAPGPAGWSTAAGRYMFTKSTWDRMGGGDFAPVNQDQKGWALAQQDYNARTGRNLDADLKAGGLTPDIIKALGPTWTGLKADPNLATNTYNDSYKRYTRPAEEATPAIAAAPTPPPRSDNLGQALPMEAGVTAPTPTAYAPQPEDMAIPVAYSGYDPYNTEAVYAATGGLVPDLRQRWVQHFAAGGNVEDDPDPYVGANDTDYQALYTGGAGDMGGIPTYASPAAPAQSQPNNPISMILSDASDAVTQGVKWLSDKFDIAGATSKAVGGHAGLRALASNEGAARDDAEEAANAVDPDKHLNDGARNLAGMTAAYKYYMMHGQNDKAKEVAGSIILYSKQVTEEAGRMALQAPDIVTGAKILAKGHNQIPGAPQFEVDNNGNYIIKDAGSGKPINAGVVSPQQLIAAATGMKDGTVFWRTLQQYTHDDEPKLSAAERNAQQKHAAYQDFIKGVGGGGGGAATSKDDDGEGGGTAATPAAPAPAAPTPAPTSALPIMAAGPAAPGVTMPAPTAPTAPAAALPTAPTAPTTAGAGVAPLKPSAKPSDRAAYAGLNPVYADTLSPEDKIKFAGLDPVYQNMEQNKHLLRVQTRQAQIQQQREAAAEVGRAKIDPQIDKKEKDINAYLEEQWTAKDAKGEPVPPPPPAAKSDMRGAAFDIAKMNGDKVGANEAVDIMTRSIANAPLSGKIPTQQDENGKKTVDGEKAMALFPFAIGQDERRGPFIKMRDSGESYRVSPSGRNYVLNLMKNRINAQFKTENPDTTPGAWGAAWDKLARGYAGANERAYKMVAAAGEKIKNDLPPWVGGPGPSVPGDVTKGFPIQQNSAVAGGRPIGLVPSVPTAVAQAHEPDVPSTPSQPGDMTRFAYTPPVVPGRAGVGAIPVRPDPTAMVPVDPRQFAVTGPNSRLIDLPRNPSPNVMLPSQALPATGPNATLQNLPPTGGNLTQQQIMQLAAIYHTTPQQIIQMLAARRAAGG